MKNKFISCLILILIILFAVPVQAATGTITIFTVNDSGFMEVSGYFEDTTYKDCTILMTNTDDFQNLKSENIAYINQEPLGNNGVFYFDNVLQERFSGDEYVLKVNGGTLITTSGKLPDYQYSIYSNNAVRIGNDIYDIGCKEYTPDNISKSIAEGGNVVIYKIGGMWFDLMKPDATSTAYFTEQNALTNEEISGWEINKYYRRTNVTERN